MEKIMKVTLLSIFAFIGITIFSNVQAASATIKASKTTATVGDSVTITITINAAAWNLNVNGTGVTSTSYADTTDDAENTTITKKLTLNTSSAGTKKINLIGDISDGTTGVTSNINTSVTVNVKTKQEETTVTKSSVNTLKSFSVSPSGLSPAFSKNTTSYKLTVQSNVTKVTVNATPTDSKASVKVSGNTGLKEGTNIVNIVVTAENGSKRTYKISVVRKVDETNTIPVTPNIIDENNDDKKEEKIELNLKRLAIPGIDFSPEFNPKTYEYTAQVAADVEELEINAIATVEDAKIEITGNKELKAGENVITILVKSKDGKETKTYQIVVAKAKAEEKEEEQPDLTEINDITEEAAKRNALQRYILMGTIAIITILIIIYLIGIYKKGKVTDAIDYTEEEISKNGKTDKGKRFK